VYITVSCDCISQDIAPQYSRVLRGVEHLIPYSIGPGNELEADIPKIHL